MCKRIEKSLISWFLIFSLAATLSGMFSLSVSAAEVYAWEIVDDLTGSDHLFLEEKHLTSADGAAETDNLAYATSGQPNVYDFTRLYKKDDSTEELDKNTYITYHLESDITAFKVVVALCNDDGKYATRFRVDISADGETYTSLEQDKDYAITLPTGNWSNTAWRQCPLQSIAYLPAGTKYLRLYFPETKEEGLAVSKTQFENVSLRTSYMEREKLEGLAKDAKLIMQDIVEGINGQYSYAAIVKFSDAIDRAENVIAGSNATNEDYRAAFANIIAAQQELEKSILINSPKATFVDECDDFNDPNLAEHSADIELKIAGDIKNNKVLDSEGKIDASFGHKNTEGPHYVTYKLPADKKVSCFAAEAAYNNSTATSRDDIIIKISTDETLESATFKPMEVTKENLGKIAKDKWTRFRFSVPIVPSNVTYVRVEMPAFNDNVGTAKASGVQMTSVKWTEAAGDYDISESADYKIIQKYNAENKTAQFDMTYNGEAEESPELWLIVAEYDAEGALTKNVLTPVKLKKDVKSELKTETLVPADGCRKKVMLWDRTKYEPLILSK